MTTPQTPLKAALIGCGRIGAHTSDELRRTLPPFWLPYSHAEAIRAVPEARLIATCDVSLERARETAQQHGAEHAFSDYHELLEKIRPDILLVATRTEGRTDILCDAAAAGVSGVHFEKPLGRSMHDCRKAMAAADAAGMKLSYGTVRRCLEVYREARRLIDEGAIGALQHVIIEMSPQALLWAAPHYLDVITSFVGVTDGAIVQGDLEFPAESFHDLTLDADPMVKSAHIKFSNQVRASLILSQGPYTRLLGETGELQITGKAEQLSLIPYKPVPKPLIRRQPQLIDFKPLQSGTQYALSRLCAAVLGRGEAPITSAEVLRSNQLGLALAWSGLHEGKRVSLTEVPEHFNVTGRQGDLYA